MLKLSGSFDQKKTYITHRLTINASSLFTAIEESMVYTYLNASQNAWLSILFQLDWQGGLNS
jgi:hypothetical protein